VQTISRELAGLLSILGVISQIVASHRDNAIVDSAIRDSSDTVCALEEKIKLDGGAGNGEKWRKMVKVTLNWNKIRECIAKLEKSKPLLLLAVQSTLPL